VGCNVYYESQLQTCLVVSFICHLKHHYMLIGDSKDPQWIHEEAKCSLTRFQFAQLVLSYMQDLLRSLLLLLVGQTGLIIIWLGNFLPCCSVQLGITDL